MNNEVVELILNHTDSQEIEIHEEYSGRGVYGKTTTGIDATSQKDFIAGVTSALLRLIEQEDYEEAKQVCDGLQALNFDSMGYGIIAY